MYGEYSHHHYTKFTISCPYKKFSTRESKCRAEEWCIPKRGQEEIVVCIEMLEYETEFEKIAFSNVP